jgi:hypothetical protein
MPIFLIDNIAPQADGDFPMVEASAVKAGAIVVADAAARAALLAKPGRLEVGQLVFQNDDDSLWKLDGTKTGWTSVSLGGGAAIGSPVAGGTANRVLYVDGSGNLADNTEFEWTGARLELGSPSSPEGLLDVDGDITARKSVWPTTALDAFWYCGAIGRRWYQSATYTLRFDEQGGYGFTGLQVASSGDTLRWRVSGGTVFSSYGGYFSGYPLTQWYSRWNNIPSGDASGNFPSILTAQRSDSGMGITATPDFHFTRIGSGPQFANGITVANFPIFAVGDPGAAPGSRLGVRSAGTTQINALSSLYVDDAPQVVSGIINTGTVGTFGLYALFVDGGVSRFDGNGTYVFELPEDNTDPTGGGGAATGRIPVFINGSLRYLAYY